MQVDRADRERPSN